MKILSLAVTFISRNAGCAFLLILGVTLSAGTAAQGECEIAFVSHHVIVNQRPDTLYVLVDNRNQKSIPTDGPTEVVIPPFSETKVSQLEWAGEFRDPTSWYVFEWKGILEGPNLNTTKRWVFTKDDKTTGTYRFVVERR